MVRAAWNSTAPEMNSGEKTHREGRSRIGLVLAISAGVLFFLLRYPGRLGPDSTEQFRQAISGHFTDWHPPIMAALWRLLGAAAFGPAPMLALQVGLYVLGVWCIFDATAHERGARRALVAIAAAFHPLMLVLLSVVLKDVQMACALVAAFGLLYRAREKGRPNSALAAAVVILLCYAALVRHNGLAAVAPILVYGFWPRSLKPVRLVSIVALIVVVGVPASNWVNHRVLNAQDSGVEKSLQLFDIAGIAHFSSEPPALPIPPGCYTPFYWDRLDSVQCGRLFQRFAAPAGEPREKLTQPWLNAVAHHWPAYAQHRLSYLNSSIYFLVSADARCNSAPEYAGCGEPRNIRIAKDFIRKNPLYWPCVWLAAGIWLLLQPSAGAPAKTLAWSGLLYGASFLIVGVATDYQYHLWTIVSIGLALGIHFSRQEAWVPPLKRLAAVAGIVIASGYAARIALL